MSTKVLICRDRINLAKENIKTLSIENEIRVDERAKAIDELSSIVLKELKEIAQDEDYFFDSDNLSLVSTVILTNAEKLKEQKQMTGEEQRMELLIYRIKDNCYEVAKKLLEEHDKQIRAEAYEEGKAEMIKEMYRCLG